MTRIEVTSYFLRREVLEWLNGKCEVERRYIPNLLMRGM